MTEHYADKAIKQAAEEIDSGRYIPEAEPEGTDAMRSLGVALGMGTEAAATGQQPTLEDFRASHESVEGALASHPRVLEAMEKMRHEIEESKGRELIEKNAALRELTEASEQKNRWDGQGRWMGAENEEMRYGEILSPQQFYDRLGKVVGKGKLKLSEHVMFPHEGAKSGLSSIVVRNPLWSGEAEQYRAGEREEALKMADEANRMATEVKSLVALGRRSEAQKKVKEIAHMVAEAREIFDRAATESTTAPPEFLRVATVQWPLGTEWMIMEFTEWGTVWKPKFYGWRTALLTMIRCGAITEAQAHKAFPVGQGDAAGWYLQQIHDFKLEGALIH